MVYDECVDVFILTNGRREVEETVFSLIGQDHKNFRAIVSDNSDSSRIRDFVDGLDDDRFSYVGHQTGRSGADNIDYCLSQVVSRYFVLMHDDDLFERTYLSRMLDGFEKNSSVVWGVCNSYLFHNSDLNNLRLANSSDIETGIRNAGSGLFLDLLRTKPLVIMPAVFYRSDVLESLHFDHSFSAIGDLKMWLTLGLKFDFFYESEPLFYYRKHSNNHSNECAYDGSFLEQSIRLLSWIQSLIDDKKLDVIDFTSFRYRILRDHLIILVWGVVRCGKYEVPLERYRFITSNLPFHFRLVMFLVSVPVSRTLLSYPVRLIKVLKDAF